MKQESILKIIDEDNLGNGIAKPNGIVTFIPGTLLNEEVNACIYHTDKRFNKAKVISIKKKSIRRIKPKCPYYYDCGGCNYLHISIEEENKKKQQYITDLLNINIDKYICVNEYNYRNKITLHVKNNILGLYKEDTNNIIDINNCLLVSNKIYDVINYLKTIDLTNITEIIIKESSTNHKILINIIGNPTINKINIADSLFINNKLIYGDNYLEETINNITFLTSANTFLQINTLGMKELYEIIKEYIGTGNNLLDLYCGSATIGMYLHNNFNNITSIDISKDNIDLAKEALKINNINNIKLICDDASNITLNQFDSIVVDPARNGLSKNVIKLLNNNDFNKIVYVSCNPKTLKRDLELLKNNYNIDKLSVINMFPRTNHIECVVLLHKKQLNKKVYMLS